MVREKRIKISYLQKGFNKYFQYRSSASQEGPFQVFMFCLKKKATLQDNSIETISGGGYYCYFPTY